MTNLPEILVQEETDMAKNCTNHPDFLANIRNDAGNYMVFILKKNNVYQVY